MRAFLVYNLPEEYNNFQAAVNGMDWKIVNHNTLETIHSRLKYANLSDEAIAELENLQEIILEDISLKKLPLE